MDYLLATALPWMLVGAVLAHVVRAIQAAQAARRDLPPATKSEIKRAAKCKSDLRVALRGDRVLRLDEGERRLQEATARLASRVGK